ncbi:unnamed protein product [[Candida] boidinii]|uniref:Unnamed protein product n=1 Tax=Candida boidinii TaxID=5477 RepID=A0ACB5U465_CANBO|nr:unnamed protein product [[Candida] boidinii]
MHPSLGIKEVSASNLTLDLSVSVVSENTVEEDTDEVENFFSPFDEYSEGKGDNEVSEFEVHDGNNNCGGS